MKLNMLGKCRLTCAALCCGGVDEALRALLESFFFFLDVELLGSSRRWLEVSCGEIVARSMLNLNLVNRVFAIILVVLL
jgi:hypothetical protein